MKFCDPKTGEVFDVEREGATGGFCAHIDCCSNCPLPECAKVEDCSDWINAHPAEAARRMGFEVVEDSATGETQGRKSLFCEQIGVLPGQPFVIQSYPYRNYPPMVYCEDGCVRLYSPDGQKRHKVGGRAITWIVDHPESVEPCEGYTPQEVAFKKEEAMEKKDKPRICEVLGVEVGEPFKIEGYNGEYHINDDGVLKWGGQTSDDAIYEIINHPDRIIRKPRFTEDEIALAGILHQQGVTELFRKEGYSLHWKDGKGSGQLPMTLFPSIKVGEKIRLEEVVM